MIIARCKMFLGKLEKQEVKKRGFIDEPLFDFNGDGETDFMELSVEMQMIASSRREAFDLTGDDTFYNESDGVDEEGDDDLTL